MSTIDEKANKFSNKFRKNALRAHQKPKSDQIGKSIENTCNEQSSSDDVLTRYDFSSKVLSTVIDSRTKDIIQFFSSRMAVEEIVKETAKGAIRAEQVGPSGWLPCPLMKTNKRFLRNTIKSVISHNRPKTNKPKKSEHELDEIIKRGPKRTAKFGDRKHCFRKPDVKRTTDSGVTNCKN